MIGKDGTRERWRERDERGGETTRGRGRKRQKRERGRGERRGE